MSVYGGPETVDSGLVLSLDAANSKSYPGYGTTWTDLSGNGYTGTLTNGPIYSYGNSGSIVFDGTNDFVTFSSAKVSSNLTITAWIKTTSTKSTSNQASIPALPIVGETANSIWYSLGVHNGKLRYINAKKNGVWSSYDSTASVNNGAWRHVVVTHSSSTEQIRLYVDGVLDSTFDNSATGSWSTYFSLYMTATKLGTSFGSLDFFSGSLSAVKIYDYLFSAAEVSQDYSATAGRYSNLPFSPSDISGLQVWLDASDAKTLFSDTSGTTLASSDGTAVALWKDKSGNTRDVSQSTSGSRPLLKKAVVNSLDGVRFDGSNDFLSFAMNTRPTSYTVFVVASKTNSSAATYCGSSDTAGNGYSRYFELSASVIVTNDLFALVGNGNSTFRYVYSATSTIALSTPTLLATTNSITNPAGIDLRIYKNASELSVTTVGSNFTGIQANNNNFAVGRLGAYDGSYLQGDIYEIVIYDSALSTTQRQQVESYLNTKWKIY